MKTTSQTTHASLRRRIRQFYKLLNEREFERCHEMIDPHVRCNPNSVTLLQYSAACRDFLDRVGCVKLVELRVDLHLQEPSVLYEDRDFAMGNMAWEDQSGQQHKFSERWVRDGRTWFTRSTGFVTPET